MASTGYPKQVRLLPGYHAVSGDVSTASGRMRYKVDVLFEPGKHYVVYSTVRGYEVKVDVVERGLPRPGRGAGGAAAEADCGGDAAGCSAPATPAPQAAAIDPTQEATLETGQYIDLYGKRGKILRGMRVTSIDEISTDTGGFWKSELPLLMKVKPGKHRVSLQLLDSTQGLSLVGYAKVWFVAEPGRRYFAKYRSGGGYFDAWIEDIDGQKVGGILGSEDEPG